MPVGARTPKPIECLKDNKGMTLETSKFRASDDIHELLGFRFEVGVPDIC
jgi:hypothetical protein